MVIGGMVGTAVSVRLFIYCATPKNDSNIAKNRIQFIIAGVATCRYVAGA